MQNEWQFTVSFTTMTHSVPSHKLFQITWKWTTIKTFERLPGPKGLWATISRKVAILPVCWS